MEETDMNADERTPGQQQPQMGERRIMDDQAHGGSASTGQASYGNSGETGTDTLSQNSSSFGQDSDLGQSNQTDQSQQSGQGSSNGLFSGSGNDMGTNSAGTGRSGIEGVGSAA